MGESFEALLERHLMTKSTFSDLVDPVAAIVEDYARSGNPDTLLGTPARNAANRLTAALSDKPDAFAPETPLVLAGLRMSQSIALSGSAGAALARGEALRLYAQLLEARPDFPREMIPPSALGILDRPGADARRLATACDCATDLAHTARKRRDRCLLREATELLRRAIAGAPVDLPQLGDAWVKLSMIHQVWLELDGEPQARAAAIDARRRAAERMSDRAERATCLLDVYKLIPGRPEGGDASGQADAVLALRDALAALDGDHQRPAAWLLELALQLVAQAERDGDTAPAREAVDVLRARVGVGTGSDDLDGGERLRLLARAHELAGDSASAEAVRDATAPSISHCDCVAPVRQPALGLSPDLSYGFGLVVLDLDIEDVRAGPTGGRVALTWDYAAFRSMQPLGSPFLSAHALRLLRTGIDVLRSGGDGDAAARFVTEATRLSRREEIGLSCIDLLESAARLEAGRRSLSGVSVAGAATAAALYLDIATAEEPDDGAPGRRGFTYLASLVGEHGAYELLAPLTFLAFVSDDPVSVFAALATAAVGQASELARCSGARLLEWAGLSEQLRNGHLLPVEMGVPVGSEFITDPLRAALRIWDHESLIEAFCRPSVFMNSLPGDPLAFRHLLAPVLILTARNGELTITCNGLADSEDGYAANLLRHVATVAAAERLTLLSDAAVEPVCWHRGCPVFASGLCHRWYQVPSAEQGHTACGFHSTLAHVAGMPARELWALRNARQP